MYNQYLFNVFVTESQIILLILVVLRYVLLISNYLFYFVFILSFISDQQC